MIVKNKNKKGFSLVEISIVILIIGLLVAGISKATDMIFDAEVKAARSLTRGSKINRIQGLTLWLESTLSESIVDGVRFDATNIADWRDINTQSVSKVFFKATGTPKFLLAGFNNVPGIRFNATADVFLPYLNSASSTVATYPSTQIFSAGAFASIFVVASPVASSEVFNFCEYATSAVSCSAGKEVKVGFDSTGKVNFSFPSSAAATASILSTNAVTGRQAVIISAVKNAGGNRLFVDGANAQTTAVANTLTAMPSFTGTFRIGPAGAANANFTVYEVLVFNTNLTDEDRYAVEDYLSKKYAIAVTKTTITP